MNEVWRILKPGGRFHGAVPYALSMWAVTDPTHKSFFTDRTFDYFVDGNHNTFYTDKHFIKEYVRLGTPVTTLAGKLRNLIPFRRVLRWFLWNMYDEVQFSLRKPERTEDRGAEARG